MLNEWETLTIAEENEVIPTGALSSGTYGRFRYIDDLGILVVLNAYDQNVFVYRVVNKTAPEPEIPDDGGDTGTG